MPNETLLSSVITQLNYIKLPRNYIQYICDKSNSKYKHIKSIIITSLDQKYHRQYGMPNETLLSSVITQLNYIKLARNYIYIYVTKGILSINSLKV